MPKQSKHFYEFGSYRLDCDERLLRKADNVVPLTPKAFDLLLALVQDADRLLTKEELLEKVWAGSFVEEANLSHNIYKLREALGEKQNGEKYIETIPRRGYRFIGKATEIHEEGSDILLHQVEDAVLTPPPAVSRELAKQPFTGHRKEMGAAFGLRRGALSRGCNGIPHLVDTTWCRESIGSFSGGLAISPFVRRRPRRSAGTGNGRRSDH